MTLDFIYENICYDLTLDNGIVYHGNYQYVTDHLRNGIATSLIISDNQPKSLEEFVTNYKKHKETNNDSIETYYKAIWLPSS